MEWQTDVRLGMISLQVLETFHPEMVQETARLMMDLGNCLVHHHLRLSQIVLQRVLRLKSEIH